MACKYTYKGITYNSKEEFINQVINSQFLSNKKVRRVMELQSDLFQKGRDKKDLVNLGADIDYNNTNTVNFDYDNYSYSSPDENYFFKNGDEISKEEYEKAYSLKFGTTVFKSKENQFLQLLNKDNNWVTFFIKSIIQDTAKQTITEVQESDVEAKVRELEDSGLLKIKCS